MRVKIFILSGIVFPTSWMPRTVARIEPEVDVKELRTREAGAFGVQGGRRIKARRSGRSRREERI